jgi:hypothetical protein
MTCVNDDDDVILIQLLRGSDAGAVAARLDQEQRHGRACVVCGRSADLDTYRTHVGYVADQSVAIHRYCLGPWQDGAVRVRR